MDIIDMFDLGRPCMVCYDYPSCNITDPWNLYKHPDYLNRPWLRQRSQWQPGGPVGVNTEGGVQGPFSLTWINFYSCMDK